MTEGVPSASERGSRIEFESVSCRYLKSGQAAVDDVSLTIDAGQRVVVLGPSGCGKTTLLKMVNRLIEPTAGEIRIDGDNIRAMDAPQLRRRIGYVIQQTGLFPHLRIEENIAVVPQLLGWPKPQIAQRVSELLALIGLPEDYRRRYPAQLSGGEQQRVGLARALAADPSMMLMDEPFGALDAITRLRLQDELLRIHRQMKQTILFVTHDIDEAVRLADKIVIMRAGRVVQYATPLDIINAPADSFVRNLVGGGEALRRLSLITAGSVMRASHHKMPDDMLFVSTQTSLRDALDMLLLHDADRVAVRDSHGVVIGMLETSDIWTAGKQDSRS